jgi:hypothetical protein
MWMTVISNNSGHVHGGALAAFADDLGGSLAGLNAPPEFQTTTIESKTNIFRACEPGRSCTQPKILCLGKWQGNFHANAVRRVQSGISGLRGPKVRIRFGSSGESVANRFWRRIQRPLKASPTRSRSRAS